MLLKHIILVFSILEELSTGNNMWLHSQEGAQHSVAIRAAKLLLNTDT
jgi:hypothetical protein